MGHNYRHEDVDVHPVWISFIPVTAYGGRPVRLVGGDSNTLIADRYMRALFVGHFTMYLC